MMNAKNHLLCALLGLGAASASAERFDLESAIIDSSSARALGGGKKSGEMAGFFSAQKELVYGALSDLGIALDSLPLDVRKNLERFQTTNFAAFKMFSLGLNAQDQGKFAEAKAFFEKAVELDPNFELAGELGVAMPNSNVVSSLQLQAVLAAAAKSATSAGKLQVEVDLSGAIAALQSGQNVVLLKVATPAPVNNPTAPASFTSNSPGASANYAARKVVGLHYAEQVPGGVGASVGVDSAFTNEWTLNQTSSDAAGLQRVGESSAFEALRVSASSSLDGSGVLGDGSAYSWGHWAAPGFRVVSGGAAVAGLGPQLQFMVAEATRAMPTTGSVRFTPAGGFLGNVLGDIRVDFLNRKVQLNNLGFDLSGYTFRNLNSAATDFSSSIASGFFKGNYSSGSCASCPAFAPTSSVFSGNFLGKNASGLMFSTVLATGVNPSTGAATAAGLQVFKGP
jgi:Tetratricopeptide repeat